MLLIFISIVSLVVSFWIGSRLIWALHRYKYRPQPIADTNLPSISVCIAARNEMHALAQCLDYVLTSNYEKIEVLVLDDSSGDETSLIIQSYAHAGVRFIAGKDLPAGWLGKNHAYQTLSEEANGDYVLYLDVDTLLSPTAIRQLVEQLLANHKSMLSVLPRREDAGRASALFSTLRYLWELVFSSRQNPPSASALWLINREKLLQLDHGLEDYGMSVRPERHIARQLQRSKDYYHLIGTKQLGVRFEKHWNSLLSTAERLYYPMFGHNPLSVLFGLSVLLTLNAPLFVGIVAYAANNMVAAVISAITLILNYSWYGIFTARTMARRGWLLRILLWPYIAVQELLVYIDSVVRYATNTVQWKGRSVRAKPTNRDHLLIDE